MKIRSITIQNFRGYKNPKKIIFNDLTLIVGKNDIGKSTILEGLDIFFGNRKVDKSDLNIRCDNDTDKIIISVEFLDLPTSIDLDKGAMTELNTEFLLNKDGYLEIKKVITPGSQAQPKTFIKANYPAGQDNLLILKNSDLKKLAVDLGIDKSTYVASVNNSIRKAIWETMEFDLEEKELEIDKEDGKKIYSKLEQEMPLYSLFSVDRKNSDQDSEIQDPIKSSIKQIIKELGTSLDPIKEQILDKLNDIASGTIEKIREMNPEVAQALKPVTENPAWEKAFSVSIESDGVPLNKRGSGVKRLVLINFFRNEAERVKKEKQKTSVIYAIEEPETSQHPDWQIKLFEAFNELTETGNIQIILTSHHPELSGLVELKNIRLLKKVEDGITIEHGSESNYKEIAKTLGVLPRIDGVKVAVCLEGPNDVCFIKNIASLFGVDRDDDRIIWLPVGGMTLRDYVNENYLRNLNLHQIHFYDRDGDNKYADSISQLIEAGHWGKITDLLTMENYFHPVLYKEVWPELKTDFVNCLDEAWRSDWNDRNIPNELSEFIKAEYIAGNHDLKNYGSNSIKKKLAQNASLMTPDLVHQMDTFDELNSFFEAIKTKI